jgi:hypothetical protein
VANVISSLTAISALEINYIVINKHKITNQSFRNAPYGAAYNYFAGVLFSEMVFQDKLYDTHLIYDMRNKETHPNKHFKEYLEAQIYGQALRDNINVDITIEGFQSHQVYGLQAVDYFSWALFRKFEYHDETFSKIFAHKLHRRREWYL